MWVTKLANYIPLNYFLQISSLSPLSLRMWEGPMAPVSPGAPKSLVRPCINRCPHYEKCPDQLIQASPLLYGIGITCGLKTFYSLVWLQFYRMKVMCKLIQLSPGSSDLNHGLDQIRTQSCLRSPVFLREGGRVNGNIQYMPLLM